MGIIFTQIGIIIILIHVMNIILLNNHESVFILTINGQLTDVTDYLSTTRI